MLHRRPLLMVLAIASFLPLGAGAQSNGSCRAADLETDGIIAHAKTISRGTDADAADDRTMFGVPSSVPDSAIAVVADSTLCARLVKARDDFFVAAGGTAQETLPIYAIRFGPVYLVYDPSPNVRVGEYRSIYIFDGTFNKVGGWTGP